jgi:hypothetical protein
MSFKLLIVPSYIIFIKKSKITIIKTLTIYYSKNFFQLFYYVPRIIRRQNKIDYPKSSRRCRLSEQVESENESGLVFRDEGQYGAAQPEGDVSDDRRPTTAQTIKRHVEE